MPPLPLPLATSGSRLTSIVCHCRRGGWCHGHGRRVYSAVRRPCSACTATLGSSRIQTASSRPRRGCCKVKGEGGARPPASFPFCPPAPTLAPVHTDRSQKQGSSFCSGPPWLAHEALTHLLSRERPPVTQWAPRRLRRPRPARHRAAARASCRSPCPVGNLPGCPSTRANSPCGRPLPAGTPARREGPPVHSPAPSPSPR